MTKKEMTRVATGGPVPELDMLMLRSGANTNTLLIAKFPPGTPPGSPMDSEDASPAPAAAALTC